jgi:hypothetical protein
LQRTCTVTAGLEEPMMSTKRLWVYVSRLPKWAQSPIQYLCGVMTHHVPGDCGMEIGAQMVDYWCRYCNFRFQVPAIESNFPHEAYHIFTGTDCEEDGET